MSDTRIALTLAGMEKMCDTAVEALGDALGLKDSATLAHSKRVTAFSIAIARALGLSREQINTIARAAFLHDIGKIATPEAILSKPTMLHPDEIDTMREHPLVGYEIIKKIPFLADAAEIVYAHHEDFDGTGYPRGLKGEEIPLGARIVAVANTFDSITSDLPHRPARSLDTARKEIQRWVDRQFDPRIVSAFLPVPDKTWEDLRGEVTIED